MFGLEVLGDVLVGGHAGLGAVAGGGDDLAERGVAHVAGSEDAGHAGHHVLVGDDPAALFGALDEVLDELQDYEGIQLIPFSAIDGSGVDDIKEVIEEYINEEE